ncbi:hypothetical protein [Phenylobacterium sp.]|uniref:hypothetical protein n=1 Tax=Phenylobacterium sp. TaxID=1871053 RepID=UPI002FDFE692
MAQAKRDEFAFAEDRTPPLERARARLSVACGDESPVSSPALKMQRALDEMLTAANPPMIDYRRGLARTAALAAAATLCGAFWWAALNWTAALVG